ncbi:calmodulin-like 4 [Crotalus adamanteus]|uniref:Calglandulin n=1 Tax=Crotalus adamanteus TaxID=8729 RepID=A0AAW1AX54_CROAD
MREILLAKFLTQDQINEFKECFSLYDKRQKGRIKASDLMVVMRSLGTSPTLGEVARHLQLHKIDVNEELEFSTFLTIMYRQIQQEDPRNEILLAMLMVDRQRTGFISVAELQAKLMNLGEKLSKEEVDTLLKNAKVGHNGLLGAMKASEAATSTGGSQNNLVTRSRAVIPRPYQRSQRLPECCTSLAAPDFKDSRCLLAEVARYNKGSFEGLGFF